MNIFDYRDYKKYLVSTIELNSNVRGYKKKLAIAAGCKPTYFSQVLNGHIHLTPEHAIGIATFLSLDDLKSKFFVALVCYGRSGTQDLRNFYARQLQELQNTSEKLVEKFSKSKPKNFPKKEIYYSNWHFVAIHILLSIPNYQTADSIALRLELPIRSVNQALLELSEMGVIEQRNGHWELVTADLHLENDSPFHILNMQNWRRKAEIKAAFDKKGLFYTGVHSLSKSDAASLKSKLISLLEDSRKSISESPEEILMCLNLDWFEV